MPMSDWVTKDPEDYTPQEKREREVYKEGYQDALILCILLGIALLGLSVAITIILMK